MTPDHPFSDHKHSEFPMWRWPLSWTGRWLSHCHWMACWLVVDDANGHSARRSRARNANWCRTLRITCRRTISGSMTRTFSRWHRRSRTASPRNMSMYELKIYMFSAMSSLPKCAGIFVCGQVSKGVVRYKKQIHFHHFGPLTRWRHGGGH